MLAGLLSIEFILVLIFGIEPKTAASKKSSEIDFKGSACSVGLPPEPVNACFSLACSQICEERECSRIPWYRHLS
jgi:hypothetical protein